MSSTTRVSMAKQQQSRQTTTKAVRTTGGVSLLALLAGTLLLVSSQAAETTEPEVSEPYDIAIDAMDNEKKILTVRFKAGGRVHKLDIHTYLQANTAIARIADVHIFIGKMPMVSEYWAEVLAEHLGLQCTIEEAVKLSSALQQYYQRYLNYLTVA